MDGYRGVRAHRWRGAAPGATARRAIRPCPRVLPTLIPVDLVGRPIEVVIGERWTAIRERWSQTTFFLFDADSWRT